MSDQTHRPVLGFRLPALTTMRDSQRLRLATLTRLRWLSVGGQTAVCVVVAWGFWWPYPVGLCLLLIALSAALNIYLTLTYPPSRRLSPSFAASVLTFDIMQPSGLLFLTGGLQNPFAVFLVVPVVISSATQPPLTTVALGLLAIVATSLLAFFGLPLPWAPGETLTLPAPFIGGLWFAIVTTMIFSAIYVYRVAAESRALADALGATELVLQREQHLSALDGLAAAAAHELGTPLATIALVAKEMDRAIGPEHPLREDIELLSAQSARCRDILRRLTSLSSSSEEHMARLPVMSLIEEVAEPHRHFGVAVRVETGERAGSPPVARRNAGVVHGLGNIVENAVDFAASEVLVRADWSETSVRVTVLDDGPGFSPEALARIGDPYMSDRDWRERTSGGGLGLGLFIAKTLLERSGATIGFGNRGDVVGARVSIEWPREAFAANGAALRESDAAAAPAGAAGAA